MIDHALGRPSNQYRKYQIFTAVLLWSLYLSKGNRHGPPWIRKISESLSKRLTPWHTMVLTMLYIYLMRNLSRLVGLEPREPLAGKYDRNYFRATWVAMALDAGFWKAMWLRPKWLRDIASIGMTLYYLVCAEQADEYVRKVRASGSDIDHMRVSWNKGKTFYIKWASWLVRPGYCMKRPPTYSKIQRPQFSEYEEPIDFWLYYDNEPELLKHETKIILDIPGGGFVAMDPRCHDDKLLSWAGKSRLPVVALNYKKAPEYPYPYALEECFDAYYRILESKGRCIGLSGKTMPRIVLSGDSAGGNLAAGLVIRLLQATKDTVYEAMHREVQLQIPLPEALIMVYPALDMNISSFMRPEDIEVMNKPEYRKDNKNFIKRKSEDYRRLTPKTPAASDDEDDSSDYASSRPRARIFQDKDISASPVEANTAAALVDGKLQPRQLRTNIKMSSMISQLQDRVLPPELLRAMILLYIGQQHKPDFQSDFLLSPLLAPEPLLARFPKVYMLCGEQDPLADDTVLFAGRLRQAKENKFRARQELGLASSRATFNPREHVETVIINGVSHGFLQFVSVYYPGWAYIDQCRRWMMDAFYEAELRDATATRSEAPTPTEAQRSDDYFSHVQWNIRRDETSSDNEEQPLEMTPMRNGSGEKTDRKSSRGKKSRGRGSEAEKKAARTLAVESGRWSPVAKRTSLVRLSSSENLMDRRMQALTGNLMGMRNGQHTP